MRITALRLDTRSGSIPGRTLVRFGPVSKRFFVPISMNNKCSRSARKVALRGFVNQKMDAACKRRNLPLLTDAKLKNRDAVCREQAWQL